MFMVSSKTLVDEHKQVSFLATILRTNLDFEIFIFHIRNYLLIVTLQIYMFLSGK